MIRRLADYGFIHADGLSIGTHDFLAYGHMLGLRGVGQERTQDVDFAHAGKAVVSLVLSGHRREALAEALQDLLSRGKGWVSRYKQGAAALQRAFPAREVGAKLASAV